MQGILKIMTIAFLVLSVICFCTTIWVISVEGGKEILSYLMAAIFALAAFWSGKRLMDKS